MGRRSNLNRLPGWASTARRLGAASALLVAAMLPVVVAPTPAAESWNGCVTWNEFRRATTGKTLLWVEARFDTHGRLEHQGGGYKTKSYRACTGSEWGRFGVQYRHHHDAWRVDYKWYDRCYDCY